jgi:hypothetical protein
VSAKCLKRRTIEDLTPAVACQLCSSPEISTSVLTDSQRLSANIRDTACQPSEPERVVNDTMLGVDRVVFLDNGRMEFDEQLLSDRRRRYRGSIEMSRGHRHNSSGAAAHDEALR